MKDNFNQIPSLEIKTHRSGKYVVKSLEGAVQLSAWAGFQSRRGPYNAIDKNGISDGTVKIIVGEHVSDEGLLSVSAEQVNAYKFMIEQQNPIKETILAALLPEYKKLQQEYGYEEDDECMPNLTNALQFESLIGLSIVHLLDVSKEGIAYVGYEFGCTWDEEHGLGVLTHKERVIEIGGADTAFDTWCAELDRDPVWAAQEMEKHKYAPLPKVKKPWWKFW